MQWCWLVLTSLALNTKERTFVAAHDVRDTACAIPASVTLPFNGDYLFAYPQNAKVSFLQAAKTYASPKSLYARVGLDASGIVGLRMDRNDDNNFCEIWLKDEGSGLAKIYTRYRDNGGATTASAGLAVPGNLMYTLWIRPYSATTFYAGIMNEASCALTLLGLTYATTWAAASCRAGLVFLSTAQGAAVVDAYHCDF